LAGLLPDDGVRLQPGALLALVDRAALQCTAPAALLRTAAGAPECTDAGAPVRTKPAAPQPHQPDGGVAHRERTDAELVAELHRYGGPLSGRQVMRLLGVGTPRATRLVRLAGWAAPEPEPVTAGETSRTTRPLQIVTESKIHHPQADDGDDKDDHMSSSTSGSTP
jgi:hypothetical protein